VAALNSRSVKVLSQWQTSFPKTLFKE